MCRRESNIPPGNTVLRVMGAFRELVGTPGCVDRGRMVGGCVDRGRMVGERGGGDCYHILGKRPCGDRTNRYLDTESSSSLDMQVF